MAKGHTVPGDAVQHLRAAPQGDQPRAQRGERRQGAVQAPLFVKEMAALRTQTAEPAAEHVLAQHNI